MAISIDFTQSSSKLIKYNNGEENLEEGEDSSLLLMP